MRASLTGARLVLLSVSFVALLVAAYFSDRLDLTDWWIWVALATTLSVLLTEPRFTNPVAGVVNSVAALAAVASAVHAPIAALWVGFSALALIALALSVISLIVTRESVLFVSKRLVSVFGSARVLGFGALSLEAFRTALDGQSSVPLVLGIGAALVLTSPAIGDALTRQRIRPPRIGSFRILGSESPNLLFVSGGPHLKGSILDFTIGQTRYHGQVVAASPDETGTILTIATTPNLALTALHGVRTVAYQHDADDFSMGTVVQGTTPELIVVRPSAGMQVGELLSREATNGDSTLYQVTHTELVRVSDDSRYSNEPRVWASQIGNVQADGSIRFNGELPDPHSSVHPVGSALTGTLPSTYVHIGNLAGTAFPVGLNASDASTGHIAVLGMSGMGKTNLTRTLVDALASANAVGVVDVGGEYSSRLGLSESPLGTYLAAGGTGAGCISLPGTVVQSFRVLAETVFAQAKIEYSAGAAKNRVIVAEEAHSLVPEWNFVIGRYDSQEVAATCSVVLQSRKFGMRFVFVSQRTANVSKSAISQCANYVVFRMLDETGLDYLSSVAGPGFVQVVRTLKPYQALVVGPAFSTSTPVIIDTISWSAPPLVSKVVASPSVA